MIVSEGSLRALSLWIGSGLNDGRKSFRFLF